MELNFVYEQLKEDNKIFEIKEGGTIRRSSKDFSNDKKRKSLGLQSANNSSNSFIGSIASNNNNPQNNNQSPALFIKLKNENTEEIYMHYRNFINRLRLSEFYL